MNRRLRWTVAAALSPIALVIFAAVPSGVEGQSEIRGFGPAHVAQERELEQKLRRVPDALHAESHLRRLTAEPALGAVRLALAEARGGAEVPRYVS